MLILVAVTLRQANAFVAKHHRHHRPTPGAKFCIGVALAADPSTLVGVAIVGRPVARKLDDGLTLEVNRTCTDGTRNANSMLYGAARREARARGYRRLITYTLPQESGASLRAAGWLCVGTTRGGKWSRRERARKDTHPIGPKLRWLAQGMV